MIIIDSFLDDFDALREHCDRIDYSGTVNPFDGVTYPGISQDIPAHVMEEVERKAAKILGSVSALHFVRLTLDGVDIPHGAHEDSLMADYLLLLYLNRPQHCDGGTELVMHRETGMEKAPDSVHKLEAWKRDTNSYEAWEVLESADMKANRAVVIPAHRMHRASAPNGFGVGPEDGRLVYSCFMRAA